jgi:hypothetical protein
MRVRITAADGPVVEKIRYRIIALEADAVGRIDRRHDPYVRRPGYPRDADREASQRDTQDPTDL